MIKIIKYVTIDILRSRIMVIYTLCLLIISLGIFSLEDNAGKGLTSLMNAVLLIVPLVSLIFSTIYMYNSAEFIELLTSQPVKRTRLLVSFWSGINLSMISAFFIGAGLPVMLLEGSLTAVVLTVTGIVLTVIFVSLAILGSVITRDKARGIGIAILMWLFFSLLYDGIMLIVMFQFSDYPLEKAMIILCSLNPVDLARIFILLKMDISMLMGYTGAVFKEFFGTSYGLFFAGILMLLWMIIPLCLALRKFRTKDL